ncbi:MAG: histidine phosphatase family protein [Novosphingobium sp. 17-62-19]|uniref:histidine phosphatase family protein n=1 Tax=Novosphingobium sp. 17-62-19 TaxID=1970406 RepID=UPI000BDA1D8B|nr:histidine phosphatase family protein [Novosphingobium sp. 17-62-19]OZA19162.1 MAG: histidine phosphatase family protein [Novosphingobium sp. 17-62-19]HQS97273.1 histidine phosphatase family protein [Novosphingobium sp.]
MSGKMVHLLRHGPPRRTGLLLGHTDEPPADPAGGLKGCVPDSLPVSHVVSSDLLRALAGAETLATMRGLDLCIDPRWRELNFGAWEALAPDALPSTTLARFWDDPDACAPPQGERWSCLRNRVAAALADIGDASLVVTHAGAMRAAVSILTGLDHRQVWAFDLPYGALLSLRVWSGDNPAGQIVGLRAGLPR